MLINLEVTNNIFYKVWQNYNVYNCYMNHNSKCTVPSKINCLLLHSKSWQFILLGTVYTQYRACPHLMVHCFNTELQTQKLRSSWQLLLPIRSAISTVARRKSWRKSNLCSSSSSSMSDIGKKVARNNILANWVRMYIREAWPTWNQKTINKKIK